MAVDDLKTLLKEILDRADAAHFNLQKPEEVDHGFGWEPTILLDHENRRVHFYFNFYNQDRLTVEISELLENQTSSKVRRAVIKTTEEAWEVVDGFLHRRCSFDRLPDFQWEEGAPGA